MTADRVSGESAMRPERVLEGRCPKHDTPLERRADSGWCPDCGVGYSMTWNDAEGRGELSLHFAPRIPPSLSARSHDDDRCPHGFPSGGWDCCRHDPSLDDHIEDT